jgi:hypothetical protein
MALVRGGNAEDRCPSFRRLALCRRRLCSSFFFLSWARGRQPSCCRCRPCSSSSTPVRARGRQPLPMPPPPRMLLPLLPSDARPSAAAASAPAPSSCRGRGACNLPRCRRNRPCSSSSAPVWARVRQPSPIPPPPMLLLLFSDAQPSVAASPPPPSSWHGRGAGNLPRCRRNHPCSSSSLPTPSPLLTRPLGADNGKAARLCHRRSRQAPSSSPPTSGRKADNLRRCRRRLSSSSSFLAWARGLQPSSLPPQPPMLLLLPSDAQPSAGTSGRGQQWQSREALLSPQPSRSMLLSLLLLRRPALCWHVRAWLTMARPLGFPVAIPAEIHPPLSSPPLRPALCWHDRAWPTMAKPPGFTLATPAEIHPPFSSPPPTSIPLMVRPGGADNDKAAALSLFFPVRKSSRRTKWASAHASAAPGPSNCSKFSRKVSS